MLIQGDSRFIPLKDKSVQCVVTSPPYFGLRNYDNDKQIGLENTVSEYIDELLSVFSEVWRVLKDDGTLWLNLGDTYASFRDGKVVPNSVAKGNLRQAPKKGAKNRLASTFKGTAIKHKDLIGVPWRVALSLQEAGWYLRNDIIWQKPNPMPFPAKDRCVVSHEYMFLLTKNPKYYFDYDAIAEPLAEASVKRYALAKSREGNAPSNGDYKSGQGSVKSRGKHADHLVVGGKKTTRNKRTVWTVPVQYTKLAHFATFPEKLIEPCILAGSREGDIVLDPFIGSGTLGVVCNKLNRKWVGIELNPEYIEIARKRINE